MRKRTYQQQIILLSLVMVSEDDNYNYKKNKDAKRCYNTLVKEYKAKKLLKFINITNPDELKKEFSKAETRKYMEALNNNKTDQKIKYTVQKFIFNAYYKLGWTDTKKDKKKFYKEMKKGPIKELILIATIYNYNDFDRALQKYNKKKRNR